MSWTDACSSIAFIEQPEKIEFCDYCDEVNDIIDSENVFGNIEEDEENECE